MFLVCNAYLSIGSADFSFLTLGRFWTLNSCVFMLISATNLALRIKCSNFVPDFEN